MGNLKEAVKWFHKSLALKGDDTFSITMLKYILESLADEEAPYMGMLEAFN